MHIMMWPRDRYKVLHPVVHDQGPVAHQLKVYTQRNKGHPTKSEVDLNCVDEQAAGPSTALSDSPTPVGSAEEIATKLARPRIRLQDGIRKVK